MRQAFATRQQCEKEDWMQYLNDLEGLRSQVFPVEHVATKRYEILQRFLEGVRFCVNCGLVDHVASQCVEHPVSDDFADSRWAEVEAASAAAHTVPLEDDRVLMRCSIQWNPPHFVQPSL